MAKNAVVVTERATDNIDFDDVVKRMPQHETDALCRAIINGINRLFNDERNRADYEQWKKTRMLQGGTQ